MAASISRRDFMRRAEALALATPFLSLVGCDGDGDGRPLAELSGATMGTTYGVKLTHLPAGVDLERLSADIERILEAVNRQMSTYRPDSELSRFNTSASTAWTPVSPDTAAVVAEAGRIGALSGGAFDATVGPLVDLWGFGPAGAASRIPSPGSIAAARGRTGHRKVAVSAAPAALVKRDVAIRVDLSGIAKGFGVDRVARHLDGFGVRHYLVEIGGEFRGRGWSPRGDFWRIGIERPADAPGTVQRVVRLDGRALATSGDYRIFFESEGARYSHIIDPRSGRPVAHGLASVTVVAATTMLADALSTALMVMGPDEGLALAEREGIAAFFIARERHGFRETASAAFAPFLIT